jgi:4-hydroxybenzoate polyprenyltransferase
MLLKDFVLSIRPKQWTKNLIIFAALIFSKNCFQGILVLKAAAAFGVFCVLSSAIYLINDCMDIEKDRLHPVKARRPIASGRVPVRTAVALGVLLGIIALVAAFLLQPHFVVSLTPSIANRLQEEESLGGGGPKVSPSLFVVSLLYFVSFVLYSIRLKNIVLLDVMLIALGFVLRAVAGAVVIQVDISSWLLICTIFLSLFLALCKRRHELCFLVDEGRNHRRTLSEYSASLLDQLIAVVSASCMMSYALYTTSVRTVYKFHSVSLVFTLPFVIYGLFRYLYLVHRRDGGGDPSQELLTDRPTVINIILWGIVSMAVIYREFI